MKYMHANSTHAILAAIYHTQADPNEDPPRTEQGDYKVEKVIWSLVFHNMICA